MVNIPYLYDYNSPTRAVYIVTTFRKKARDSETLTSLSSVNLRFFFLKNPSIFQFEYVRYFSNKTIRACDVISLCSLTTCNTRIGISNCSCLIWIFYRFFYFQCISTSQYVLNKNYVYRLLSILGCIFSRPIKTKITRHNRRIRAAAQRLGISCSRGYAHCYYTIYCIYYQGRRNTTYFTNEPSRVLVISYLHNNI